MDERARTARVLSVVGAVLALAVGCGAAPPGPVAMGTSASASEAITTSPAAGSARPIGDPDATLRRIAGRVARYGDPSAAAVTTTVTRHDEPDPWRAEQTWTVDAGAAQVAAWYRARYPYPDGVTQRGTVLVGLMLTSAASRAEDDSDLQSAFVTVGFSALSPTRTRITVEVTGFPRSVRSPDTLLRTAGIVRATLHAAPDDATTGGLRAPVSIPLDRVQTDRVVALLDAAQLQPVVRAGSTVGGTTYAITFALASGVKVRARFDTDCYLAGVGLDLGPPWSRRLVLSTELVALVDGIVRHR